MELLTTSEMAEADRLATAGGITGITLMENAGRAVADAAAALPGRRVVVVAGPGNNGGDGFVAARLLAERGYEVRLLLTSERSQIQGDAAIAAVRWSGPAEPARPEAVVRCDIIIDALFGAGLARPVEAATKALIEAINASGCAVVAVDLPSGIDGNSGQVMGAAVRATETVTFFRRKPGHLLLPGRIHCGKLHVAQIGISDNVLATIRPQLFANEPPLWLSLFPRPQLAGHKYDRGHTVVVSGHLPMTGAARLAARGALRIGSGLVTIASPKDAVATHAGENVAVMVIHCDGVRMLSDVLADRRRNSVILGPGAGQGPETRDQVAAALASGAAVTLDADALSSFADRADELTAMIKGAPDRPVVLTPHAGEFSRLFNSIPTVSNLKSKHEKTRAAARYCGAVIVLKGADTVTASPDGRAAIAANAPPTLATAGAGDVLAGIIGGLMAQHMPAFEAACAGVWLHGEAARDFGPGLISEDIPERLPPVLARLATLNA
ncbi:MAG: NAD(P)H-hydrate dehydratase [Pseudolabrys sp.]|nr:NAD(P)H-hydrate dehydratase [Pseudolabrys sp.]